MSNKNNNNNNENNQTSEKKQIKTFAKLPRNVNEYRHILKTNVAEKNWVLDLRQVHQSVKLSKEAPNFDVYGKHTQSSQNLKTIVDISSRGSISNLEHLYRHRLGPTASGGLVEFESKLRSYTSDKTILKKEQQFSTVPYKDKSIYPQFLPNIKETNKLLKEGKNIDQIKYSAFDGTQNFKKFQEKFTNRNVQNVRHLINSGHLLPHAEFHMSLR